MIVTPFGEITFGDRKGLQAWVDAHARRHSAERLALAKRGQVLPSRILTGSVDADWFHRHLAEHLTLARFPAFDFRGATSPLAIEGWVSPEVFQTWHQAHNRLHLRYDRNLGLI